MRALLIAAGEGARWGNYTGVPKHLVNIDDEILLHRTVRQLEERGITDVFVVGPDDARYRLKGTSLYTPVLDPQNGPSDKFLSSRKLWSTEYRTLFLYGDVYFTDGAMDKITDSISWKAFLRPGKSRYTGCEYGEVFGVGFDPEHHTLMDNHLDRIARLSRQKRMRAVGGWYLYRAMCNRPLNQHVVRGKCVKIDDWTDDFDKPEDYDRWTANWEKAKKRGTIPS